jgi:hypothetical protein
VLKISSKLSELNVDGGNSGNILLTLMARNKEHIGSINNNWKLKDWD